jgi:hypothetical protein
MGTLSIIIVNIECYRHLLRRRLGRTDRAMVARMLARAEARRSKVVAMKDSVADSACCDRDSLSPWSHQPPKAQDPKGRLARQ